MARRPILLFSALTLVLFCTLVGCREFSGGWRERPTEVSRLGSSDMALGVTEDPKEQPVDRDEAVAEAPVESRELPRDSSSAVHVDIWSRSQEYLDEYVDSLRRAMRLELEVERRAAVMKWRTDQPLFAAADWKDDYPRSVLLARIGSFEARVRYDPCMARDPWRSVHPLTELQLLSKPYPEPVEGR